MWTETVAMAQGPCTTQDHNDQSGHFGRVSHMAILHKYIMSITEYGVNQLRYVNVAYGYPFVNGRI